MFWHPIGSKILHKHRRGHVLDLLPNLIEFCDIRDTYPALEDFPKLRVRWNMQVLLPSMKDVPPAQEDEGLIFRNARIYLCPVEI
jgi:hypothetical protein